MISFIVPVYNTESYIKKCIDSIINSGIKDFEIIIINDGSTDNSFNICREYEEKYNNIILISQCNQGVSIARNEGLKVAKGEWIVFVDSDDYIFSNSLSNINLDKEIQFYIFEYSNSDNIDEKFSSDAIEYDNKDNDILIDYIFNSLCISKGRQTNLSTPWAKIYKKEIIDKNNLSFIKELPIGEDVLFNLNYILKCNKSIYIKRPIYHVEEREGSASRKFNPNKIEHDKIFNDYIKDLLVNSNKDRNKMYIYYDNIILSSTECVLMTLSLDSTSKRIIDEFIKIRGNIKENNILNNCSNRVRARRKVLFYLLYKERYMLLLFICKSHLCLKNLYLLRKNRIREVSSRY